MHLVQHAMSPVNRKQEAYSEPSADHCQACRRVCMDFEISDCLTYLQELLSDTGQSHHLIIMRPCMYCSSKNTCNRDSKPVKSPLLAYLLFSSY